MATSSNKGVVVWLLTCKEKKNTIEARLPKICLKETFKIETLRLPLSI